MSYAGAESATPNYVEFLIEREFPVARELLWQAWTQTEHIPHWWGPVGYGVRILANDLRPGGLFHYALDAPDGETTWGRYIYREVEAPARLEFMIAFADEQGEKARAPLHHEWPLEVLAAVELAEQNGRTMLTLRGTPHDASSGELRAFVAGHSTLERGWTGAFNQLDKYLASLA